MGVVAKHRALSRKVNNEGLFLVVAVFLLLIPIGLAVMDPLALASAQFFLKIIAATGGALIGAVLPGFLQVTLPAVRAGGALGLFAVIFYANPASQAAMLANPLPTQIPASELKAAPRVPLAALPAPVSSAALVAAPSSSGATAAAPDKGGSTPPPAAVQPPPPGPAPAASSQQQLKNWLYSRSANGTATLNTENLGKLKQWMGKSGTGDVPVSVVLSNDGQTTQEIAGKAVVALRVPKA